MADNLRDRKADRFDGRIETVGIKKRSAPRAGDEKTYCGGSLLKTNQLEL